MNPSSQTTTHHKKTFSAVSKKGDFRVRPQRVDTERNLLSETPQELVPHSVNVDQLSGFFVDLPMELKLALAKMGIHKPTPIQEGAFAAYGTTGDVLAQSHTGSGKTLAFGICLAMALRQEKSAGVRSIVLTPTRELAVQVSKSLDSLVQNLNLRVLAITGGASYHQQKRSLDRGVDIVVGTPGRICDLIAQGALDLSAIKFFVLDEVDEMLDIGFSENLKEIRAKIPEAATSLFFSATLSAPIRKLAKTLLKNPTEVKVEHSQEHGAGKIHHGYIEVMPGGEWKALIHALLFYAPEQALIFCKTKAECSELVDALLLRGVNAAALHGDLVQEERNKTMNKFRSGQVRYLVATNVAARGLDVRNLPLVVNYSVPEDSEVYTHRAGRTGRAGAQGRAWTLVTPRTVRSFESMAARLKLQLEKVAVPQAAEILQKTVEKVLEQVPCQATKAARNAIEEALQKLSVDDAKELLRKLMAAELAKCETYSLAGVVPERAIVRCASEGEVKAPNSNSHSGGARRGQSRGFFKDPIKSKAKGEIKTKSHPAAKPPFQKAQQVGYSPRGAGRFSKP